MVRKSTRLQVSPQPAKHPKHSKFAIIDIREKPVNVFYCSTLASTLVSAITLLTQVPVQKFPFLFIFIIPCIMLSIQQSTWFHQYNIQNASRKQLLCLLIEHKVTTSQDGLLAGPKPNLANRLLNSRPSAAIDLGGRTKQAAKLTSNVMTTSCHLNTRVSILFIIGLVLCQL